MLKKKEALPLQCDVKGGLASPWLDSALHSAYSRAEVCLNLSI